MKNIESIVDEIFDLYQKYGDADYIGEPVSQLEHMSQAAQLAIEEGCDDEVVLAAFFHDIGHICASHYSEEKMAGYGVRRHEQIGAEFLLERGFSSRVARLVENHVQAKRYLTYKYPGYYENLSEASKKTLEFQGGRMNTLEASEFERDPLFDLSVRMRRWDELAKEVNTPLLDLELLKSKARIVLAK